MSRARSTRTAAAPAIADGATLLPLAILDGYKVKWSRETVARDIVQNFFDEVTDFRAVSIEVTHPSTSRGGGTVRVAGPSTFALDYLRYVGATTKRGKRTAGGFGEGFKVCALVLVRDYHAEVIAGSGAWRIRPLLLPMKLGRELHYEELRLPAGEAHPGSYVEIRGADEALCRAFEGTRELFQHPGNPRLARPLHVDAAAGIGVYYAKDPKRGDVFYRRQHRGALAFAKGAALSFTCEEHVEGIHADRDRRALGDARPLLRAVVRRLPVEALETMVRHLRVYWSGGNAVLRAAVEELASRGVRLAFSRRWAARVKGFTFHLEQQALRRGILLAGRSFARLGMQTLIERFGDKEVPRQPTKREAARVAVARALHRSLVGQEPESRGYVVSEMKGHAYYGTLSVLSAHALAAPFDDGIGDVLAGLASGSGRRVSSNADRLTALLEAAIAGRVDLAPYRACWKHGRPPPDAPAPIDDAELEGLDSMGSIGWPVALAIIMAPSGFPPVDDLKRRITRLAQARRTRALVWVHEVNGPEDAQKEFARGLPSVWIAGQEVEPPEGPARYEVRTFVGPRGPVIVPTDESLAAAFATAHLDGQRFDKQEKPRRKRALREYERFLRLHDPERLRLLRLDQALHACVERFYAERESEVPAAGQPDRPLVRDSVGAGTVAQRMAHAGFVAQAGEATDLAAAAATAAMAFDRALDDVETFLGAVTPHLAALPPKWHEKLRGDVLDRLSHAIEAGADPDAATRAALAQVPFMVRLRAGASTAPLDDVCSEACLRDATDSWFARLSALTPAAALVEAEERFARAVAFAAARHDRKDRDDDSSSCYGLQKELDEHLGPSAPPSPKEVENQARERAVAAAWEAARAAGLDEVAAAARCLAAAAAAPASP